MEFRHGFIGGCLYGIKYHKMNYRDKLKHPKWQKRRLEILSRDNFTCRGCGSKEIELHVHHKVYYKFRDPWDYADNELITYCILCHNWEHKISIPGNDFKSKKKIPNLSELKELLTKKNRDA